MQAEAGAGRDPPIGIWGSQTGLFLYLGEGSEILLPKNMMILGWASEGSQEQVAGWPREAAGFSAWSVQIIAG